VISEQESGVSVAPSS